MARGQKKIVSSISALSFEFRVFFSFVPVEIIVGQKKKGSVIFLYFFFNDRIIPIKYYVLQRNKVKEKILIAREFVNILPGFGMAR